MKVKCVIDKVNFEEKPQGAKTGAIINRMTIDKATDYSIEEIKNSILEGKTIRPSYCGAGEETWQSQQMFMIDIDNKPAKPKGMSDEEYRTLVEDYIKSEKYKTYEQVIEKCKANELVPNFVYTSFNHKPEHHKMRLVFILDKNITGIETAKKIQLYLMDTIGDVDEQCKNLNRIYYAGRNIVFNSGNLLSSDRLIELSKDIELDKKTKKKEVKGVLGVLHNNDIYNIPLLSSTQKTPSIKSDTYTIKAITNRDIKYLKNKYGCNEKKVFETNQEFMDYIRKEINLGELLEFNYPKSIRCLFHDDSNNSAGIFQADDGAWIYKCFGCGISYNIVGVIERLAGFKSRPKTYKFIREIFNLGIMETEWQKEQKDILLENLKILNNGEFEKICPQGYKNIKGIKHYLEQLILIAMDNIYNEDLSDEDGQVVFYASADYICKQMGISPNSINKIYQKLVVLTYHKLLNKLDDKEIPERFLKRAKAIAINSGKNNHVNFFSIPSLTVNKSLEIEERGKQWKANHYTMKGASREMFYRAEGLEIANELYPQYKKVTEEVDGEKQVVDRTTTKASDDRTNNIAVVIHNLIEQYDYATERGIVERLRLKYAYITTEVQIKKSLKEILDSYGWERIRANKEIKEKYNVDAEGYPFLIVKNI